MGSNFAFLDFFNIMKTIITRSVIRTAALAIPAIYTLAATASAADAATGGSKKTMLEKWVTDGGWTMIPLIILFAVTIFLVVFNLMALKRERFCPEPMRLQLIGLMSECRVQSAIHLATESPTFLGRLVAYALPNIDANRPEDLGKDSIEDAIADFTTNERPQTMKFIDMLALIGQIAPSIGLFGTVQGMIGAFAVLSDTGSANPTQLAGSISVALLTTFWGLIVSIIAIPAFFFLKKVAQAREADCVNTISEMVNTSINVINAEAQLARIPEGLGEEPEYIEGGEQ